MPMTFLAHAEDLLARFPELCSVGHPGTGSTVCVCRGGWIKTLGLPFLGVPSNLIYAIYMGGRLQAPALMCVS